ncbi:amidohydrolase family protein [Cohnella hashimotonis]|uniref:Amidohydrolase family protein n=1 Tax=Cohnella hashimotonis TaxID=2826895 RepID=A0ABT6TK01_9BACL|nr:amidohydrolase family protein [Cohnella hashimotonis]MDI4646269.1 amidohydrolase family protein [Cohnella hashimotonis]
METRAFDLIAGALDPSSGEKIDIEMRDGAILGIAPAAPGASALEKCVFDASGFIVTPGLVETHIHLDKAFLSERLERPAANLGEAIAMTAALKPGYTLEDVTARSRRALDRALSFGVALLRAQVEIDPVLGLLSFESALALKEELAGSIALQLVAFPQEGIFNCAGTESLLREAVSRGADAIGGIPYNDRDTAEHLDFVFRLAADAGLPVDLHLDFSDDPEQLAILDVIHRTREYGLEGRVCVGHLTSLGSVPPEHARRIADGMAEAGIHVFALPATDLYLNGRGDTHAVRRGITPVSLLLDAGVNVCYGTNNLRNAFTPFGTGDPLDIALLLAQTAYMGTPGDARRLLDMCTGRAAKALGVEGWTLRPGAPADFALIRADCVQDLVYDRPRERVSIRGGKLLTRSV